MAAAGGRPAAPARRMNAPYDAIVVGGGLAGLAAAHALRGLRVLLLEREERLGGRILTRRAGGLAFDLGAIFGFDPSAVPFAVETADLVREDGPVGLLHAGRLRLAPAPRGCMAAALDDGDRRALDDFAEGRSGLADLPVSARSLVEAFHHVIHPALVEDYIEERRRDAFVRFETHHLPGGNDLLVRAYAARLDAEVRCAREVLAVSSAGEGVEVACRGGECLRARAAIVAVPAPAARRILRDPAPACRDFLGSVRFEGGLTLVAALRESSLPDFAYAVATSCPVRTIIRQRTSDRAVVLVAMYLLGADAEARRGLPPAAAAAGALADLGAAGLPADGEILAAESRFWEEVGAVVSEAAYRGRGEDALMAAPAIHLAGDYALLGSEMMPYGMTAAIRSGESAARRVRARLDAPRPGGAS